jgi:hypothetical protein
MKKYAWLLLWGCLWLGAAAADKPPAPVVEALFPSGDRVPANHLKFYIHFSVPMRQGVFQDYCRLLDENGAAVLEPFRETELWSEDGRRLTLWLHPGRQKTGVNLNVELGPILMPGRRYKLVVSGAWPSSDGVPLGRDIEKTFQASARATKQLDVHDWKIHSPPAGDRLPLEIRFPSALDHALLSRCLTVVSKNGAVVGGLASTAEAECCWRFTPAQPWTAESHQVIVKTILEDLAGNSLARPFEVDLTQAAPAKAADTIAITFTPAK